MFYNPKRVQKGRVAPMGAPVQPAHCPPSPGIAPLTLETTAWKLNSSIDFRGTGATEKSVDDGYRSAAVWLGKVDCAADPSLGSENDTNDHER